MIIMNKKHKDWDKFCDLLEGKEGCNFKETIKGKPESITWKCKGGNDKSFAISIIKKHFPFVDITESMKYFDSKGGHCDCEIIFNVN